MTKPPVPRVVVPVLCIARTRSPELLHRGHPLRRAWVAVVTQSSALNPWMYSSCQMLRPGELRALNWGWGERFRANAGDCSAVRRSSPPLAVIWVPLLVQAVRSVFNGPDLIPAGSTEVNVGQPNSSVAGLQKSPCRFFFLQPGPSTLKERYR
jgi:hypothetical protein